MTSFTFARLSLISILSTMLLFSCQQAEEEPAAASLSDEEVVELVEASMSTANGGVSENLATLSEDIQELTLEDLCDSLLADTTVYAYQGVSRQASYTADWTLDVTCNGFNIPQTAAVTNIANTSFSGPRIDSNGEANFSGTVSGLQLASAELVWNGTYLLSGSQTLRFREERDTTFDLEIEMMGITITKVDPAITAGTATFSLDVVIDGDTLTYTGSITFNGNQTATLVVNGETYDISLE